MLQKIPGLPDGVTVEIRFKNIVLEMSQQGQVFLDRPKLLTMRVMVTADKMAGCFYIRGGKVMVANKKNHPVFGQVCALNVQVDGGQGQWTTGEVDNHILLAISHNQVVLFTKIALMVVGWRQIGIVATEFKMRSDIEREVLKLLKIN